MNQFHRWDRTYESINNKVGMNIKAKKIDRRGCLFSINMLYHRLLDNFKGETR